MLRDAAAEAARALFHRARSHAPSAGARLAWTYHRHSGDDAQRIIGTLVRSGQTVVDAGANWGLSSWYLAKLVGPGGRVHAFEPEPGALRTLRRLAASTPAIEVHAVALSDHVGQARLRVPLHRGRRISALASIVDGPPTPGADVSVATTRLDDVLRSTPVAFLKCDVEGHELEVLRGADALLRRERPALYVEIEQRHQAAGTITSTFDHLLARGYGGWSVHPGGLRALAEFDVERDQLAHLGDGFVAREMPAGYVNDFVFLSEAAPPPRYLLAP